MTDEFTSLKQTAAREILLTYGCENIRVNPKKDDANGHWDVGGKKDDKVIIFEVDVNPQWGLDELTGIPGKNWADERYPWGVVKFPFHKWTKMEFKYNPTHNLMLSADGARAFMAPNEIIRGAKREMIQVVGDEQYIAVHCGTEGCHFLVRDDEGKWKKDRKNVWAKPSYASLDVDEFLESLNQ